jgi:hypothetical protein
VFWLCWCQGLSSGCKGLRTGFQVVSLFVVAAVCVACVLLIYSPSSLVTEEGNTHARTR